MQRLMYSNGRLIIPCYGRHGPHWNAIVSMWWDASHHFAIVTMSKFGSRGRTRQKANHSSSLQVRPDNIDLVSERGSAYFRHTKNWPSFMPVTLDYILGKVDLVSGPTWLVLRIFRSGLRRRAILGCHFGGPVSRGFGRTCAKKSSRFRHVLVYIGDVLVHVGDVLGWGRDKSNVFFVVLDSGAVGFGDCGG